MGDDHKGFPRNMPDAWSDHYHEGLENEKKGRYSAAIQEYSAAIDIKPKNSQAFFRRGLVYYAVEEYEKAVDDLNSAIRLDPSDLAVREARSAVLNEINAERNVPTALRTDDLDSILLWPDGIFDDPIVRHGTAGYYSDQYFSLVKDLRIQESMPEAADCFYFHGYYARQADCWWELFPEPDYVRGLLFNNGKVRSGLSGGRKSSYWEYRVRIDAEDGESEALKTEGTLNMGHDREISVQTNVEKHEGPPSETGEADSETEPMLPLLGEAEAPPRTRQVKLSERTIEILCLGCASRGFHIKPADLEYARIMTFVCPACGEHTAVSQRKGGGIVVAVDRYAKGEPQSE